MNPVQNICFFNTTPFWGGGEKWHFETAVKASEAGHQVYFVCQKGGELSKRLASYNIVQEHVVANNRSFLNPVKINQLAKFFTQHNIDAVIFNSPKDLKLGGKAAKKAKLNKVVYRRGIAVEVKKKTLTEKLFKDVVTHFIFNSEATKQLLIKNYSFIPTTKKTQVIYNAISFPELPKKDVVPKHPIVIGNAGRMVEQKGQKLLIDIAAKLAAEKIDFKIKIAGDGPLLAELKNKAKAQNLLSKIEFLGFVENMEEFMNEIDILVSTALWEGFGFVLAEAMAAKKPVLAFALSSNPELIQNDKNGYLIPPNNTTEFADKLALLISSPEKIKALGEAGYSFAKNNFEVNKQFQKFMEFISD